jgi:cell division protein FtsA
MQRTLRARRAVAMKRGLVAVLDIGTSKFACLVLKFDPDAAEAQTPEGVGNLNGHGDLRVIGAATTRARGMEFGDIVSMDEAERAIRTAVQGAQKMAGVRVDHVVVTFSGGRPRSYGVHGQTEVEEGAVSAYDIGRVLANCDIPDYGAGAREPVHALPVHFILDNQQGLHDPRGLVGKTLGVDLHLLTVGSRTIQNIMHCVKRCDLELCDLAISSYASALSALVEDERELGAACIDLGAGTTGVSIFMRRQMIFADAVRMGGAHITRDICQGLEVPAQVAERLKTFHGGLVATGVDDRDFIEIASPIDEAAGERRTMSRSDLIGIIRPRMEEILDDVGKLLDAAGFDYMPSQRIVITGGGSQMPGLEELAYNVLGRQVRCGRPLRIQGLPHAATGPGFSSVVGLAMHTVHPQDECWDFDIPSTQTSGASIKRAVRWFKENW